ncbi:hypothetical protein NXH76_25120 [Blautia schinkii]|nr:hypothetical protein [Blautia schinkii]
MQHRMSQKEGRGKLFESYKITVCSAIREYSDVDRKQAPSGSKHTSNDLSDLKSYAKDAYTGAECYIARNVVSDHNIVTANGTAPIDFAREILRILHAAPDETIEEWFLFHRLGCYAVREAQY